MTDTPKNMKKISRNEYFTYCNTNKVLGTRFGWSNLDFIGSNMWYNTSSVPHQTLTEAVEKLKRRYPHKFTNLWELLYDR